MLYGYGDNRIRIYIWLTVIFLLLIVGMFLAEWKSKKLQPVNAQSSESDEIQKIADGKTVQIKKSVLTSPLGRMGWHPDEPEALTRQIEGFFKNAEVKSSDDVIAQISPHAGYQYSGQTAAFGVKAARSRYVRVVVIGPSHQAYMNDTLSVPRMTHYKTPIGEITLDIEFINKLLKHEMFKDVPAAYKAEHSVFIQLPMLQLRLKKFKLVPVVTGQCSQQTVREAADILKSLVDKDTLVVASSDFVHYGANYSYVPFSENIPEELKKLDMGAYDHIAKLDGKGFLEYCDRTGATICGRVPIAILLSMLPATVKPEMLKYTTSGEMTGDFANSVSYFAIAFHGQWPQQTAADVEQAKTESPLTQEDHRNLLFLARRTIEYYLQNDRVPTPEQLGIPVTEPMKVSRAAFVTLKENSELRGCIGEVLPSQSLYKSVIVNAINAAVNDWRFKPVTRDELGRIKIEISALTVPQPIISYNQIRLGTDGIILRKDGQMALFLPQVATEQMWTLDETLTQLALKAGLPRDGWQQGATFEVFQAEVFGDE
ncbi:MAG: AmmeMemoRadiSam system protein B [Sedimentisphaerales bacterium]|nr:AmmeMemoRadiSam system protein B [Sedimentisphaerales bacterium]